MKITYVLFQLLQAFESNHLTSHGYSIEQIINSTSKASQPNPNIFITNKFIFIT